jgi:2-polyprenyl-3-methyl-5-hydroxy-6-metoxy-1,4-benzoquinol methylase
MNLTNPEYWSNHWEIGKLPNELNVEKTFSNYSNYYLHNFFKKVFNNSGNSKKIIEIGCGDSVVLPYFYNKFKLNIFGIDYSEIACERSKKIIENSNSIGEIKLMDLFRLDANYLNAFDFVFSNGVIEHFEDNTIALKEMKKMLSQNGVLITGIPNMTGLTFQLLKLFNKNVYDTHNVFGIKEFIQIHENCNLEIISSHSFPISLYIPLDGLKGIKKKIVFFINKFLILFSRIYFALGLKTNNYLSSAFFIVSKPKL